MPMCISKIVHPPPEPEGFEQLPDTASIRKEKGWVSEAILTKHAYPPAADSRVRLSSQWGERALTYARRHRLFLLVFQLLNGL